MGNRYLYIVFFRFAVDVYLIRDVIYAITSLVNTEFEYNQVYIITYLPNVLKFVLS